MNSSTLFRPLGRLASADTIDFWLQHWDPLLAVAAIRARVVAIRSETPRVRTFTLRPNRHWPGFRAGQHSTITVEIDGRRLRRTFTLAGAETDRLLQLTVGRQPQGRVTTWMHDHLEVGAVVELSAPRGTFVLPDDAGIPLLLIAGGTGITPCLSMLRTLAARRESRDVTLIHYVHAAEHAIAAAELDALAAQRTGLRVHRIIPGTSGRFSAAQVRALVPDVARRRTYVCGPTALMDAVEAEWQAQGRADELAREWFGVPSSAVRLDAAVTVECTKSGRTVLVPGARPLLDELEAAGLSPRYGCRAGICHQCACKKVAGNVTDVRTGAHHAEPSEPIQLCAVRATGPLVLDL